LVRFGSILLLLLFLLLLLLLLLLESWRAPNDSRLCGAGLVVGAIVGA